MSNTITPTHVRDTMPNSRLTNADSVAKRGDGESLQASGELLPRFPARVAAADVSNAVQNLSEYVQTMSRELHISVDEESGRTVIRVIDPDSKELIRQIPQEEILALARDWVEDDERGRLLRVLA